jgi:hypothetical protein
MPLKRKFSSRQYSYLGKAAKEFKEDRIVDKSKNGEWNWTPSIDLSSSFPVILLSVSSTSFLASFSL